MAQYVLAGTAQCTQYARAEILADDLSINLPDFKVHKIVLSEGEWSEWLKKTCSEHGWSHTSSPLVWRELVDRGGAGTYLGGWDDFRKMAEHWYNYGDKLDNEKVKDISSENKTNYEKDKAASVKTPVTPVRVSVIGAAQPLAYQLLPLLFGSCFNNTTLAIVLQDVADHADVLEGVRMELEDCAFGELHSLTVTHDVKAAVAQADYVVILDPIDNTTHPDRFLLLKSANLLYKDVAAALKGSLKPDAKVVINGYKACLGGMLLKHYGLTTDNISAVVTLDEQRLRAKLAKHLNVMPSDISGITVWGNVPIHDVASPALGYVCNHEGAITGPGSYDKTVKQAVNEEGWESRHVDCRDDRDKEILKKTGRNADIASALAIYRHIESLALGSSSTTMGCLSSGQYGTTSGSLFGFPVSVTDGVVNVREVGEIPEKLQELIGLQDKQLQVEKQVALGECDDVEAALQVLEGALWKILEHPKLKRQLEEKESERLAKEEAERKAAEARAKEEAKRKAEEEALKQAEAEAAAAAAAAAALEEDDADEEEDEE